ncbi:hypothetical protein [Streptomyces flavofungini]|uniref:hypothetical protein n=1 Tax=Streptomyces flavofungini TaxID=68200 RepID=UPI0034DEE62D
MSYDVRVLREVPEGPQLPLAITEYVPSPIDATLYRTSSVDRNMPYPELFSAKFSRSIVALEVPVDTRKPSRTMLDIPSSVRVHLETLLAAHNDMGVCDAIEQYAPAGKP